MAVRRDASKAAVRFHARWVRFLLSASVQTLKRVAHELYGLEKEHAGYRDGTIFRLLRTETEFVIKDVSGSDWTVQRSLRDLRGRTRRNHQQIDPAIRAALAQHLSPFKTESDPMLSGGDM